MVCKPSFTAIAARLIIPARRDSIQSMIEASSVRQNGDEPTIRQTIGSRAIKLPVALAAARTANDGPAVRQDNHAPSIRSAKDCAPVRALINGDGSTIARSIPALRCCRHRQPQQQRAHDNCDTQLILHCFPPLNLSGERLSEETLVISRRCAPQLVCTSRLGFNAY